MSKNTAIKAQKRSAKRNARSKSIVKASNRSKQTNTAKAEKLIRKIRSKNKHLSDFDNVLNQAVRDINKGKKSQEIKFNTPDDLISGIKQAVSSVFKLYAYITLANKMIENGTIKHEIKIGLEDVSLVLISLDKRVRDLEGLKEDEQSLNTEALEIGTDLSTFADIFQGEIDRLEVFGDVIENTINKVTEEVPDEEAPTFGDKRRVVLESIAYEYLNSVMAKAASENVANDEDAKETPAEE